MTRPDETGAIVASASGASSAIKEEDDVPMSVEQNTTVASGVSDGGSVQMAGVCAFGAAPLAPGLAVAAS